MTGTSPLFLFLIFAAGLLFGSVFGKLMFALLLNDGNIGAPCLGPSSSEVVAGEVDLSTLKWSAVLKCHINPDSAFAWPYMR